MTCVACRLGRIWECRHAGNCSDSANGSAISGVHSSSNLDDGAEVYSANGEGGIGEHDSGDSERGPVREVNTYKTDATLKDQQSTGRKRAAVMYPLDPEADCEWKMQKNCGGGNNPIVGCADGKQQARHHGPDKNTLNNDAGNVHRICHQCHNRWHARNDEGYVWGSVYRPHSPEPCTQEELIESELSWLGVNLKNVVD